jgi:enolase
MILSLVFLISNLTYAVDKKFIEGSEKINPDAAALDFISKYSNAINSKNEAEFVALMDTASLKSYKESKHPDYYQMEFKKWFEFKIKSLEELRKYKMIFESHKLLGYPENPTHIVIFKGEAPIGNRMGVGVHSMELIEKNGKYSLVYRCM